ncbi:hypothetical protein [Oceanithermus sp.]
MVNKKAVFTGMVAFLALLFAGCGAPQESGTATIEGTVVNTCGVPQPYVIVFITGHEPVITDSQGHFAVEGVSAPYDLVINGAHLYSEDYGRTALLVYQGLTRTDPLLTAAFYGEEGCVTHRVSGAITPEQASSDYRNGAGIVAGKAMAAGEFSYDASPSYSLELSHDPGDTQASLFAMQWRRDTSSRDAVEYLGYARKQITLGEDESLSEDLVLEGELESLPVQVTLAGEAPFTSMSISQFVSVDGENLGIITAEIRDSDAAAAGGVYNFVAPQAEGIAPLMAARGGYGDGLGPGSVGGASLAGVEGGVLFWQRLEPGATSLEMAIPELVVPITPLNGAWLADPSSTRFAWSGPEGAIYDVFFGLEDAYLSVEVITTSRSLTLPDLSELGISYDREDVLFWEIYAMGGEGAPASVDEVAGDSVRTFIVDSRQGVPLTSQGYYFSVYAGDFGVGSPGED